MKNKRAPLHTITTPEISNDKLTDRMALVVKVNPSVN